MHSRIRPLVAEAIKTRTERLKKPRRGVDLVAAVDLIVRLFAEDPSRRSMPTQEELAALGPVQPTISKHQDEIWEALQRRVYSDGFDSNLRERIAPLVDRLIQTRLTEPRRLGRPRGYIDIEAAADHIVALFEKEPLRKRLPTHTALAKKLDTSFWIVRTQFNRIVDSLRKKISNDGVDAALRERISQSIARHSEKRRFNLTATVDHIIQLFQNDDSIDVLPTQRELVHSTGFSQTTLSMRFTDVLVALRKRIKEPDVDVSVRQRIQPLVNAAIKERKARAPRRRTSTFTVLPTRWLGDWLGLTEAETTVGLAPLVEGSIIPIHYLPFFPLLHKDRSWHMWAVGMPLIYASAALVFLITVLFTVHSAPFTVQGTFIGALCTVHGALSLWFGGIPGHALYNWLARKYGWKPLSIERKSSGNLRRSKKTIHGTDPDEVAEFKIRVEKHHVNLRELQKRWDANRGPDFLEVDDERFFFNALTSRNIGRLRYELRDFLAEKYDPLAKGVAKKVTTKDRKDAYQVARIGLLYAIANYDLNRLNDSGEPIRFTTYAPWEIRSFVQRATQKSGGPYPENYFTKSKVAKAEGRVMAAGNHVPKDEEIAAAADVSPVTVRNVRLARSGPMSLELRDHEGRRIYEAPSKSGESAADLELVPLVFRTLTSLEIVTMKLLAGMGVLQRDEEYSLREIGAMFGRSYEQIRKIRARSVGKVAAYLDATTEKRAIMERTAGKYFSDHRDVYIVEVLGISPYDDRFEALLDFSARQLSAQTKTHVRRSKLTHDYTQRLGEWLGWDDAAIDLALAPVAEGSIIPFHYLPFFPLLHKERSWHMWVVGMPLIYTSAALVFLVTVLFTVHGAPFTVQGTFIGALCTVHGALSLWFGGIPGHALYNWLARRYGWSPLALKVFDFEAATNHVIQLFEADEHRKQMPTQYELADTLGITQASVSNNYSDFLLSLRQRAQREKESLVLQRIDRVVEALIDKRSTRATPKKRQTVDVGKTVEWIIRRFADNPFRRSLPTQAELSETLGPSQGTFSLHDDEILLALSERVNGADFDPALRERIGPVVELALDKRVRGAVKVATPPRPFNEDAAVDYIMGLFASEGERVDLPSQKDISRAIETSPATVSRRFDQLLLALETRARERDVTTSVRERIERALAEQRPDVSPEMESSVPPQTSSAENIGPSQTTDRPQERTNRRGRKPDVPFNLEETVRHIVGLFVSEPTRISLPTLSDLSESLGPSLTTIWKQRERIVERLSEFAHGSEPTSDVAQRLLKAIERSPYRSLRINNAVNLIIRSFSDDPSRVSLPSIPRLSRELGWSRPTVSTYFPQVLVALESRLNQPDVDPDVSQRIEQAIRAHRASTFTVLPTRWLGDWLELTEAQTTVGLAPLVEGSIIPIHYLPIFPIFHKKRSWHMWVVGMPLIYTSAALVFMVTVLFTVHSAPCTVQGTFIGALCTVHGALSLWFGGIPGHALYNWLALRYGWQPLSLRDQNHRQDADIVDSARDVIDRFPPHYRDALRALYAPVLDRTAEEPIPPLARAPLKVAAKRLGTTIAGVNHRALDGMYYLRLIDRIRRANAENIVPELGLHEAQKLLGFIACLPEPEIGLPGLSAFRFTTPANLSLKPPKPLSNGQRMRARVGTLKGRYRVMVRFHAATAQGPGGFILKSTRIPKDSEEIRIWKGLRLGANGSLVAWPFSDEDYIPNDVMAKVLGSVPLDKQEMWFLFDLMVNHRTLGGGFEHIQNFSGRLDRDGGELVKRSSWTGETLKLIIGSTKAQVNLEVRRFPQGYVWRLEKPKNGATENVRTLLTRGDGVTEFSSLAWGAWQAELPAAPVRNGARRQFVYQAGPLSVDVSNPNQNYALTSAGALSVGAFMQYRQLFPDAKDFPHIILAPPGSWTGVDGANLMQIYFLVAVNFHVHKRRTTIVATPEQQKRIRRILALSNPRELPNEAGYSDDLIEAMRREAVLVADRSRLYISPDGTVTEGPMRMVSPADADEMINFETIEPGHSVRLGDVSIDLLPEGQYQVWDGRAPPIVLNGEMRELDVRVESFSRVQRRPEFGVTVLGQGSGFNSDTLASNQIVWANDLAFLVDIGPATIPILSALNLGPRTITHIVITHLHEDHVAGALAYFHWAQYHGRPIRLVMEPGLYKLFRELAKEILGDELTSVYNIEFIPLRLDGRVIIGKKDRKVVIFPLPALHGPAIGLEFIRNGHRIIHSGDTAYNPALVARAVDNRLPDHVRDDLTRATSLAPHEPPMTRERADLLLHRAFAGDNILLVTHDAGAPDTQSTEAWTNHTSARTLSTLPTPVRDVLVAHHTAELPPDVDNIRLAKPLETFDVSAHKPNGWRSLTHVVSKWVAARLRLDPNGAGTHIGVAPAVEGTVIPFHYLPIFPWMHKERSWHMWVVGMPLIYASAALVFMVTVLFTVHGAPFTVQGSFIGELCTVHGALSLWFGGYPGHVLYNWIAYRNKKRGWKPLSLATDPARPTVQDLDRILQDLRRRFTPRLGEKRADALIAQIWLEPIFQREPIDVARSLGVVANAVDAASLTPRDHRALQALVQMAIHHRYDLAQFEALLEGLLKINGVRDRRRIIERLPGISRAAARQIDKVIFLKKVLNDAKLEKDQSAASRENDLGAIETIQPLSRSGYELSYEKYGPGKYWVKLAVPSIPAARFFMNFTIGADDSSLRIETVQAELLEVLSPQERALTSQWSQVLIDEARVIARRRGLRRIYFAPPIIQYMAWSLPSSMENDHYEFLPTSWVAKQHYAMLPSDNGFRLRVGPRTDFSPSYHAMKSHLIWVLELEPDDVVMKSTRMSDSEPSSHRSPEHRAAEALMKFAVDVAESSADGRSLEELAPPLLDFEAAAFGTNRSSLTNADDTPMLNWERVHAEVAEMMGDGQRHPALRNPEVARRAARLFWMMGLASSKKMPEGNLLFSDVASLEAALPETSVGRHPVLYVLASTSQEKKVQDLAKRWNRPIRTIAHPKGFRKNKDLDFNRVEAALSRLEATELSQLCFVLEGRDLEALMALLRRMSAGASLRSLRYLAVDAVLKLMVPFSAQQILRMDLTAQSLAGRQA